MSNDRGTASLCPAVALCLAAFCCLAPSVDARCEGTSNKYSHSDSARTRYLKYVVEYSNCTKIRSNLEIVFLHDDEEPGSNETFDLSFLASIKEVDGYVLIVHNTVDVVPLTSLRVIHGRKLMDGHAALYVAYNILGNYTNLGLKELQLPALREIVKGDVVIRGNNLLCYEDTILWDEIVGQYAVLDRSKRNDTYQRPCGELQCDPRCQGHCWGEGPDQCQDLQNQKCHHRCPRGQCYGPGVAQCCHEECAGGCNASATDCFSCRNFVDDGVCVNRCDPNDYDPQKLRNNRNANVKFSSNYTCVSKCPSNMPVERGACVTSCDQDHRPDENNFCVPCPPGGCRDKKVCMVENEPMTSKNIANFTNCTEIDNLRILPHAFLGEHGLRPLTMADLSVLESVRVVFKCLMIQGFSEDMESLSFLRNLQTVKGVTLCGSGKEKEYAMIISGRKSKIKSLGLTSLESVQGGALIAGNAFLEQVDLPALRSISARLTIVSNARLCYVDSVNWTRVTGDATLRTAVNATFCESLNRTCSDECEGGCWGPGPALCVRCVGYRYNGSCLPHCSALPGLYAPPLGEGANESLFAEISTPSQGVSVPPTSVAVGGWRAERECGECHPECINCTGPNANDCVTCRHVKEGENCVSACPRQTYIDAAMQCQRCSDHCAEGCTGPKEHVGEGGCNRCRRPLKVSDNETLCMADSLPCPDGFYSSSRASHCLHCHAECARCTDAGKDRCTSCMHMRMLLGDNIPTLDEDEEGGANEEDSPPTMHCVSDCPRGMMATTFRHFNVCVTRPDTPEAAVKGDHDTSRMLPKPMLIGMSVFGAVVLVTIIAVLATQRWRVRRARRAQRLKEELLGLRTLSANSPSNHKPDLSFLKLINDSELTRGVVIGSGAFGTVHKGVWAPSGETVRIHVAIKVLSAEAGSTPAASVELLEEARIMAAVRHPCCIRILTVCLTAQLELVTQLMPLGALLDYVRTHRTRIGSNALVTWARQIAQGMEYLEEMGIVHRDLAARNVLVEGPEQVKITDFGLAKLVHDKDGYLATGGKVPIKWLALESIQHRKFTHKSDVWSYGVTLWELFTFGQRPYENVPAKDVCDVLEKGERLLQPPICTIDVYMIMIKCWMVDADSRPTFSELVDAFFEFEQDPGRYLVIQGDEEMGGLPPSGANLREMLRGLSILEDPWGTEGEEGGRKTISAEEYLKPHDLAIEQMSQAGRRWGAAGGAQYTNGAFDSQLSSPQDSLSLAEVEAAFKAGAAPGEGRGRHDRKQSFRYCPNPSKDGAGGGTTATSPHDVDAFRRPVLHKSPSFKPEPEIPEAMVEDDYLRPCSAVPKYLDLVHQNSLDYDDEAALIKEKGDYVNDSPRPIATLGNPEYYQPKLLPCPHSTVA